MTDTQVTVLTEQATTNIQFSDNMDAFKRIYRASRAAWRAGENPLTHYFSIDNSFKTRQFGLEIEFNSADELLVGEELPLCNCECCDYCYQDDFNPYYLCEGCTEDACECTCICEAQSGIDRSITPVGEWLYSNDYTQQREGLEYDCSDGSYAHWSYEQDSSVTGGEVITPIMSGNGSDWFAIREVLNAIKGHGGSADDTNCGGHVNIDVTHFSDKDFQRLAYMAATFEDVMYRLGANPFRAQGSASGSYHRGCGYAEPIFTSGWGGPEYILNGIDVRNRMNESHWINFDPHLNRVEFRVFDGTLDPALFQTFTLIASAFVDAAQSEDNDDLIRTAPPAKFGHHVQARKDAGFQARSALSGEAWEKDTETIRKFVDLLFDNTQDKERVVTLFAANDWNYSRSGVRSR